jgi:hypothetical protein
MGPYRRPALEGPGDGHYTDRRGASAREDAGALPRRGAGGEHVVHEHDVATGDQLGPAHGEGVADIPPAGRGVEISLGLGRHCPNEGVRDYRYTPRPLEAPGQEQGLVVAPLARAARVERDRHEGVG